MCVRFCHCGFVTFIFIISQTKTLSNVIYFYGSIWTWSVERWAYSINNQKNKEKKKGKKGKTKFQVTKTATFVRIVLWRVFWDWKSTAENINVMKRELKSMGIENRNLKSIKKNSNLDSFCFSVSVSSYFLLQSFREAGAEIVQTICWYVHFIAFPQVLFFQFVSLLLFYVLQHTKPIVAYPPSDGKQKTWHTRTRNWYRLLIAIQGVFV